MLSKMWAFFNPPVFPDDEEKTRRARALNALHLNMGGAMVFLGGLGVLFFFAEKTVTSIIVTVGVLVVVIGMVLSRRGWVNTSGVFLLVSLWGMTVYMLTFSGGIRSLDILFFGSGTVIAGIVLGGWGAIYYAALSLATGLIFAFLGNASVLPTPLFTFPPFSAWIVLTLNLAFILIPLQVTLDSLFNEAVRARANEERYRLIASVMSDYAFSIQYGNDGDVTDQWIGGAFEVITGYTPNEYFARGGWPSILHPDDREQDAHDMAHLYANQKVVTEVRIIRKDGDIRWVRSYGHPKWDEKNNRLAGIYGAVQDITGHKQVESELHEREVILKVVVDAANIFLKISEWSAETWQIEVNKLLENLGATINATHAYIFENYHYDDGSIQMSMRYEWVAPGFMEDIKNPKYQNMPLSDDYMVTWNKSILHGDPYIGDKQNASVDDLTHLRSRGIYALLDVPIYVDDEWWGIIGFDDMKRSREWSNAEVGALVIASNLLGSAIKRRYMDTALRSELQQRKTLIEELERRNAESETLRESAAIVAASLERSETLTLILEQIARVVPYQSASIQLINGNMLEIVNSRGLDFINQDIEIFLPINEQEPAYPVVQGKVPYILYEDVQVSVPSFNEIPHNNIRAWMAVPLKAKERVMGVIAMDGNQVGQFTERDAKLAVTYANQAAIALENSRLFTELQVELSLKQKLIDELENKNAELERFTYTVSHDLRSPLVTIRGFLGYLESDVKKGNLDGFHKDLERISNATLRMDKLLKDLLELSRIGRLVNKPQDVPFSDLVNEALEIVHGRLEKHGITIRTHPNLPLIHGDKPRLIEVLQNLIDNAAKYMGDQKEPVIEIGMDGYDARKMPIFFVRDNGIGVLPEYHERIFRLFDKLDATSEGTGVGLALVKRIIEFHEGRIWVESAAGQGSTFYFTLPPKPETDSVI